MYFQHSQSEQQTLFWISEQHILATDLNSEYAQIKLLQNQEVTFEKKTRNKWNQKNLEENGQANILHRQDTPTIIASNFIP